MTCNYLQLCYKLFIQCIDFVDTIYQLVPWCCNKVVICSIWWFIANTVYMHYCIIRVEQARDMGTCCLIYTKWSFQILLQYSAFGQGSIILSYVEGRVPLQELNCKTLELPRPLADWTDGLMCPPKCSLVSSKEINFPFLCPHGDGLPLIHWLSTGAC